MANAISGLIPSGGVARVSTPTRAERKSSFSMGSATQMSPRWGLRLWEHTCYTNVAPLGLASLGTHSLHKCRPAGACVFGNTLATQMSPRWGLRLWEHTRYTNVAPLGLASLGTHSLHKCRPAGETYVFGNTLATQMSPRWGNLRLWEHVCYTNVAPLGKPKSIYSRRIL